MNDSQVIYISQQTHLTATLFAWDSVLPDKFDLYSETTGGGYVSTSDASDAELLGLVLDAGATPANVAICKEPCQVLQHQA